MGTRLVDITFERFAKDKKITRAEIEQLKREYGALPPAASREAIDDNLTRYADRFEPDAKEALLVYRTEIRQRLKGRYTGSLGPLKRFVDIFLG